MGRGWLAAIVIVATAGVASADPPRRAHEARASFVADAPARPAPRRARDPVGGARRVTGRERPYHVAFTFDDGPSAATTPDVLAALEKYDVPAAFFVVGRRFSGSRRDADDNAAVLGEILAGGHLIGNHTLKHLDLSLLSAAEARTAVAHNQEAIARRTGLWPALFRAPFGRIGSARPYLRTHRFTVVGWSIDPRDFVEEHAATLRQRILAAIVKKKGGVVLLHDTHPWTVRELPGILADLEAENCRRRAVRERLIVPVSLHYFLRERSGRHRAVPRAVAARTKRYLAGLRKRCTKSVPAGHRRVDKNASPH